MNARRSDTMCDQLLRGRLFRTVAAFALVMLLGSATLYAQQYRGTLTGIVTDASGANIANAKVTATDVITKFTTSTVTNGSGVYTIPLLNPDTYSVTVAGPGFTTQTRTGIVLTAGGSSAANFSLQVGSVAQKVVVTANNVQLDTQSANVSTTFNTKEVTDIPNVGRNPFVLSTLAAGVTTGAYMQSEASVFTNPFSGTAVQIAVNGNGGHVRLTLDGIPDDPAERLSGTNYTGFVPSPEAVQEVKSQTTLFDNAEFGHGAAVTNTVLRSGTNKFHGAVYYVFRNTYLDANQYQRVPNQNGALNPASPTHRVNDQWSQPGFVVEGPVIIPKLYNGHDKTFFMVAYERIQSKSAVPYATSTLVPTDAERGGNFSSLCSDFVNNVCAPGAGVQIYDPSTADANGNRTPFPGNIIPTTDFNATGAALMKFYPEPNTTTGGPAVNYISATTTYPQKYFSIVTRIDHSFSPSNKMNGTFFKDILNQLQPNDGFPTEIGLSGSDYTVYRNNEGGSLEDVIVASPTLVVDARLGVIYHPFGLIFKGLNYDLSSIGMSAGGAPYHSFPGTSFSDNYGGLAAGAGGQISTDTVLDPALLVSKSLGNHSLRMGFESNITRYNVQNPQSGFGTFAFNRQFTQQNSITTPAGNDPNSGSPMASLLLGYPSSGSYGINVSYALQQLYYAAFVQDDWRVTPRLTINAGLRWDYESPFTERYNRQNAAFCTTCVNPLQSSVSGLTLNGGLTFVTPSNRHPFPPDYNNVQPRFGMAYTLDPNVVLRGGFGIVYLNTLERPLGQGFSTSTNYVATIDNTHPANNFSNPFPSGVTLPSGSSLGLATQLGQSVSAPDPNHTQPKLMQYAVNAQVQLPGNLLLQIAYVGQRASQLEINKSINGIPAQYYNQGAAGVAYLQQLVPNPMAGFLPGSSLNAPQIQRQHLLVPFPEFTGVTDDYASRGSTLYNSMQTSVIKRMSHGFSLQGNFTWQKLMDQTSYLNPGQDSFNQTFRREDPEPSLIANVIGIYQFASLSGHPRWERSILGGWQANGVLRAQNGTLVSSPSNVTLLSDPRLAHPTYGKFFNTCYLNPAGVHVVGATACASSSSTPAFQQHLSFTLNNIGPSIDVRERIHPLVDASLFKSFQTHEGLNFEIRGEFFNVLNTPNFGGPGTGLGSSNFGIVTLTQGNDPRLTSITARINF